MAGDPITEGTTIDFSGTTFSTSSTADVYIMLGHACESTAEAFYQLRKALMKLERVVKMKRQWVNHPKLIPSQAIRPDIQLRGVRLDGRGWA